MKLAIRKGCLLQFLMDHRNYHHQTSPNNTNLQDGGRRF
jgi:hypothetical protein